MERRKFFKSLGALGLAAIIPKFLLGKDDNTTQLRIVDNGKSQLGESWTSWHDGSDSARVQSDRVRFLGFYHKGVYYLSVDENVIPEGMDFSDWVNKFESGEVHYNMDNINIDTASYGINLFLGLRTYIFCDYNISNKRAISGGKKAFKWQEKELTVVGYKGRLAYHKISNAEYKYYHSRAKIL